MPVVGSLVFSTSRFGIHRLNDDDSIVVLDRMGVFLGSAAGIPMGKDDKQRKYIKGAVALFINGSICVTNKDLIRSVK